MSAARGSSAVLLFEMTLLVIDRFRFDCRAASVQIVVSIALLHYQALTGSHRGHSRC